MEKSRPLPTVISGIIHQLLLIVLTLGAKSTSSLILFSAPLTTLM